MVKGQNDLSSRPYQIKATKQKIGDVKGRRKRTMARESPGSGPLKYCRFYLSTVEKSNGGGRSSGVIV